MRIEKGSKQKIILVTILLLAVFLRFWQLQERFIFSGETNNVLYAMEKLVQGRQSPLLGLVAAEYVQHLFHSPWYLYLMAPVFIFFDGDPLAFAVLHALLGVVGTYLLFRTGEMVYSTRAGFLAAFLNTVWQSAIKIDRSVWSVGLVPFGSILAIYLAVRVSQSRAARDFIKLGIWLGIALSFHYQTLLMIGLLLTWIWCKHRRYLWHALTPIAVSLMPLIIFDLRHNFFNLAGLWLVARSVVEKTRPYSSVHFLFQLHRPLLLMFAVALSKINKSIVGVLLVVFATFQLQRFFSYRTLPNYAGQKTLVGRLLDRWDGSLEIFFRDKSSYEYRYLLEHLARKRGIDPDTIVIYEPWQPENNASIVVSYSSAL